MAMLVLLVMFVELELVWVAQQLSVELLISVLMLGLVIRHLDYVYIPQKLIIQHVMMAMHVLVVIHVNQDVVLEVLQ